MVGSQLQSISELNDTKECVICGKEFSRIDYPQCFDRMVTCGNIECMGKRRYQKWRLRYINFMKNNGGGLNGIQARIQPQNSWRFV